MWDGGESIYSDKGLGRKEGTGKAVIQGKGARESGWGKRGEGVTGEDGKRGCWGERGRDGGGKKKGGRPATAGSPL